MNTIIILNAAADDVKREFEEIKTPYRLAIRRGAVFLFADGGSVFMRTAAGAYVFATC